MFTLCVSVSSHCLLLIRTSLMAQRVKNLLAIQETRVRSLGREDPLEKGMATTHSSIPAWRIPKDWRAWVATFYRITKSWTWLSDKHTHTHTHTHTRAGLGTPGIQYDVMLTNYICNDLLSEYGHVLRQRGLGLQHTYFLGGGRLQFNP